MDPLKQGHLQQVAEEHAQAAVEDLCWGRLHSLSGHPVPVLCHRCPLRPSVDVLFCLLIYLLISERNT